MLAGIETEGTPRERCIYFDKFVKDLWDPLFRERAGLEGSLALVALGGYGEGYLCAGSDVDLLFLHAGLAEKDLALFLQRLIYPLWDYGFEVTYRIFTPKEALDFALQDPTFLTALLSARLIYGSRDLFEELTRGFQRLISGRTKEIYLRLKNMREQRLARVGEEIYFLEPHLKDGPGGLRDYQFLLWAGRIVFGLETPEDLVRVGFLTPEEAARLREAVNFLHQVRDTLHHFCQRKVDRLYMEYQPEIARRLGYGADRSGTENFISDLFRTFAVIRETVEDLMDFIEDLYFPQGVHRIPFKLAVSGPAFLREIFQIQAREGRPLSRDLRKYLRGRVFREEELQELSRIFPHLLTERHSLTMLRTLRTTGVLFHLLPEFRKIQGKVQYDLYHLYALDEHLFLTVEALHRLREERPELWREVRDPRVLYFAALVHDIAKGEPQHARAGAEKVKTLTGRFGFSPEETEEIVFLVREHLLLFDTALRRDLAEEKVAEEVALRVGTVRRLAALYLLTLADARATGPRALTSWKAELLEELYHKVRKVLEARPGAAVDLAVKRERLLAEVSRKLAESIPLPQLEIYDLPVLKRICALVQTFQEETPDFLVEEIPFREGRAVFVVSGDRPGLLADLCGSFLAAGFRIRRVRAFTWPQGLAVDEFLVEPLSPEAELRKWSSLFRKVLRGEEDLEGLISRRTGALLSLEPRIQREPHSEVRVDQESSDFYTLLEIYTPEKPSLLYRIANVITKSGFMIGKALVSEKEDLAVQIFYLQTREGEKLPAEEAERLQQKIQNQLKEVAS